MIISSLSVTSTIAIEFVTTVGINRVNIAHSVKKKGLSVSKGRPWSMKAQKLSARVSLYPASQTLMLHESLTPTEPTWTSKAGTPLALRQSKVILTT
jgi:hypothetical protein